MNFWQIVNRVIDEADVILEVLDARLVQESRNIEIEEKVKRKGKKIIYVINKVDLIKSSALRKQIGDIFPRVLVSSKKKMGTLNLRKVILMNAENFQVKVGVLGYPNTGKSSIINALKGRKSAPISSVSGYTRGKQKVRADNRIILIDTPGVIPFKERDELKHVLIATKNVSSLRDPEHIAMKMLDLYQDMILHTYKVKAGDDEDETLENIAIKLNLMLKGGVPDTKRAAIRMIDDWQKGKIEWI